MHERGLVGWTDLYDVVHVHTLALMDYLKMNKVLTGHRAKELIFEEGSSNASFYSLTRYISSI